MNIPFTKPTFLPSDYQNLLVKANSGTIMNAIDRVDSFYNKLFPQYHHYFVNSCTNALEMAAYLLPEGGEVILPDFTFVTSASAFAARNFEIVFCDVDKTDLCLDVDKVEKMITKKTRAIVWVDYAGNSKGINKLRKLCDVYNIILIQDAAQSVGNWLNESACFVGDYICFSYHATKNITSGGEGGSLLVSKDMDNERAQIVFEKGTNRNSFLRGEVDKYRWIELGSSFVGSYTAAALLENQLTYLSNITAQRQSIWRQYHEVFSSARNSDIIYSALDSCANGHIFWAIVEDKRLLKFKRLSAELGVQLVSHYQTLQGSPAGQKYSTIKTEVPNSELASTNLIRFPLWYSMSQEDIDYVLSVIEKGLT